MKPQRETLVAVLLLLTGGAYPLDTSEIKDITWEVGPKLRYLIKGPVIGVIGNKNQRESISLALARAIEAGRNHGPNSMDSVAPTGPRYPALRSRLHG